MDSLPRGRPMRETDWSTPRVGAADDKATPRSPRGVRTGSPSRPPGGRRWQRGAHGPGKKKPRKSSPLEGHGVWVHQLTVEPTTRPPSNQGAARTTTATELPPTLAHRRDRTSPLAEPPQVSREARSTDQANGRSENRLWLRRATSYLGVRVLSVWDAGLAYPDRGRRVRT
jgi:hypothetical protein